MVIELLHLLEMISVLMLNPEVVQAGQGTQGWPTWELRISGQTLHVLVVAVGEVVGEEKLSERVFAEILGFGVVADKGVAWQPERVSARTLEVWQVAEGVDWGVAVQLKRVSAQTLEVWQVVVGVDWGVAVQLKRVSAQTLGVLEAGDGESELPSLVRLLRMYAP